MTSHDLDLMPPKDRRELLNAYLDGELSADQALIVSLWLDSNPGALREVEHLRHIWDLLESYEDEPVPEDFASGVMDRVGHPRPAAARMGGEGGGRGGEQKEGRLVAMAWYRRPLATAAAVLVAIGATAFVMSDPSPQPTPRDGPPTHVSLGSVARLEALGVRDLETLEYLHVIADADDETFDDLLADAGMGG